MIGSRIDLRVTATRGHWVTLHHSWIGTVRDKFTTGSALAGLTGHRLVATSLYHFTPRFRVHAQLEWIPSQKWPSSVDDSRSSETSRLSADITLQKDLYRERLQFSLGIRSLGNRAVILHPDGSADYLSMQVTLLLRLRRANPSP